MSEPEVTFVETFREITIEHPPEEWRAIPGWGFGSFEASSTGEIRRRGWLRPLKKRLLQEKMRLFIRVASGTGTVHEEVHVLVASAFLGPRPKGTFISFKNGDVQDCRADNLVYLSQGEATYLTRVRGGKSGGRKLGIEQVIAIRRAHKNREGSAKIIGRRFGISQTMASKIIARKAYSWVAEEPARPPGRPSKKVAL